MKYTLAEFLNTWPIAGTYHADGSVSIPDTIIAKGRFQFWRLSDYRVTSVIAGSIWLMPRK